MARPRFLKELRWLPVWRKEYLGSKGGSKETSEKAAGKISPRDSSGPNSERNEGVWNGCIQFELPGPPDW